MSSTVQLGYFSRYFVVVTLTDLAWLSFHVACVFYCRRPLGVGRTVRYIVCTYIKYSYDHYRYLYKTFCMCLLSLFCFFFCEDVTTVTRLVAVIFSAFFFFFFPTALEAGHAGDVLVRGSSGLVTERFVLPRDRVADFTHGFGYSFLLCV